MKGDKGNCQILENGKSILKTKFDTIKNCQKRIDMLLRLEVTATNTKIYKCNVCGMFHMGSPSEIKQYSKK